MKDGLNKQLHGACIKPIDNNLIGLGFKPTIICKVGIIDYADLGDFLILMNTKDINIIHKDKQCNLLNLA